MTTSFFGSQIFAPRRSRRGLRRRGPLESWTMARSTLHVTISPGVTLARPAAFATSFWARLCAIRFVASALLEEFLQRFFRRLDEVRAPTDREHAALLAHPHRELRHLRDQRHAVHDRRA